MSRTLRMALLAAILLVGIGTVGLRAASSSTTSAGAPTQPPADDVPDARDAAKAAAQEYEALPSSAAQVDCAPGLPTLPIYTQLSGFGRDRLIILSDGRCFRDEAGPASGIVPEQVDPEVP